MDEIAILTERFVAAPAPDLESLALKFTAILWLIEVNESVLDSADLRRLRRFRRETSPPSPVASHRNSAGRSYAAR